MRGFCGQQTHIFVSLIFVAAMGSPAAAQAQPGTAAKPLPAGQVIDSVSCASDPVESYALYLPTRYTPGKPWPIIYTFDPEAHGIFPVKLYKDAAEKYGYIIAASNNSRNFQKDAISRAADAIWQDTHTRLVIDPRRIYMMGFSGGARVATTLALRCENCAVAGVIAHGAGYPDPSSRLAKDHFAYFGFIGDKDFNWPELMQLRRTKEVVNAPFRLKVYDGEHQWAPAALFEESLEWLQLKAMQNGSVSQDTSLVDHAFSRMEKEASEASEHKNAIAEFEAYRSLATDFSGLKDVRQYERRP